MHFLYSRASLNATLRCLALGSWVLASLVGTSDVGAQGRGRGASSPRSDSTRQAQRLDTEFRHEEARAIFHALIDHAPTPAERAAAQRRMALSHAYDGNCAMAVELE